MNNWLHNPNTAEFLCIWETGHKLEFNCGEFAINKSQALLISYTLTRKRLDGGIQ